MSTLQEIEVVLKFKIAGYDLDTMDYKIIETKAWLAISDAVRIEGCLMNDFQLAVNNKKVKP